MERLASMSPEGREQALQRMRDRGIDTSVFTAGGNQSEAGAKSAGTGTSPHKASRQAAGGGSPGAGWQQAQTIDALFPPLADPVTPGRAWLYVGNTLKLVRLRLGVSDGTYTEVLNEELAPGTPVVTAVTLPNTAAARATGGQSPLMGPQRGTGGPPGVRNASPSR
jgi:hypothetical protein